MRHKQMKAILASPGVAFLIFLSADLLAAASRSEATDAHWQISGDMSEACTCAVPCTCNFGRGPSPHHYCYSLFSLAIEKGHYSNIVLDGLHLAGVHGKKGVAWYIDQRANPEQAQALTVIATHLSNTRYSGLGFHVDTAQITQEVGGKGNRLEIAHRWGFEADYIIGLDNKTPVIVENNTTWNIPRSIKGKAKRLRYRDRYGNKFDLKETNSNQGKFDWNDQTQRF
jgi:hypothetical protein